ncbi:Putative fucosyltransferase-like protein [Dendrobium catenatum]|uniref:Fucosyltransferase-like protein n=1 Tax=Dendrobium catenatum TaxID=906689 RepID=A0A2I0X7S4_9ASPA|nr:Putative fucosyltransferase-like protein [Dendrobium catenatum]
MGVPSSQRQRKRWSSLVPIFAAIMLVAEIAFLSRMDMAKSSDFVQHWTTSFYLPYFSNADDLPLPFPEFNPLDSEQRRCEERLKREDDIPYSRDFTKDPVFISGVEEVRFVVMFNLHFIKLSILLFLNDTRIRNTFEDD